MHTKFSLRAVKRAPTPKPLYWQLPQYVDGGYTVLYIDSIGDCFCAACATWERFKTEITSGPFWEGDPEYCANCNREIESSYGPVEGDAS